MRCRRRICLLMLWSAYNNNNNRRYYKILQMHSEKDNRVDATDCNNNKEKEKGRINNESCAVCID